VVVQRAESEGIWAFKLDLEIVRPMRWELVRSSLGEVLLVGSIGCRELAFNKLL